MTIVTDPTISSTSGVTLGDLVQRVRDLLYTRENLNILAEPLSFDDDSVSFKYTLQGLSRGTEISIGDEVCYIWDTDTANKTATVQRGYGRTQVTAHDTGEQITVGGKGRKQITDAINDELSSLSGAGLYQMKSADITGYNVITNAYVLSELAGAHIYDVQYFEPTTSEWFHIPGWSWQAHDASVVLPTFSWPAWNRLRVLYKTGFNSIYADEDDIQGDAGLQSEAADILVYGAAARLIPADEVTRNNIFTQGDTRRPEEVPAGAILRTASWMKTSRDERIKEEKDRLRRSFPTLRAGW